MGFKTVANVAATAMTHLTAMANVTANGKVLFQHGVVRCSDYRNKVVVDAVDVSILCAPLFLPFTQQSTMVHFF